MFATALNLTKDDLADRYPSRQLQLGLLRRVDIGTRDYWDAAILGAEVLATTLRG